MVETTAQTQGFRGLGALENFSCVLKNIDGTRSIEITQLVKTISIYEDIFSKTLFGNVAVTDGINLMNGAVLHGNDHQGTFPIVGEEFIELEYKTTGFDTVTRRFAVHGIQDIKVNDAKTMRDYLILICSEEHIIDATTTVQKSYQDQISVMVKDLLDNYLKVSDEIKDGKRKKKYDIQPTRGKQHIVIPSISPIEALDFLSKRSIAAEKFTSATYLFFENKDGFNFCDIEYLIHRGKKKALSDIKKYKYYLSTANITDKDQTSVEKENPNSYKNILNLKQDKKFDTIEKIRRGYFESEMIVYDTIHRKLDTTFFKFADKYKDLQVLGAEEGQAYPENSLDYINSVTQDKDKKFLGIFSLMKDKPIGKHTKQYLIMKDLSPTFPDTFMDEIIVNRNSYLTRFAQNMWTADVYGDPDIGAGDVILIDLPEIAGTTGEKGFDAYLSGYFMVASIHHKLTPDTYSCSYDLYKNGFSTPVVTTDKSDIPEPSNTII